MIHARGGLYWIGGSIVYSFESVDPPRKWAKHPFQLSSSIYTFDLSQSLEGHHHLVSETPFVSCQPIRRQTWWIKSYLWMCTKSMLLSSNYGSMKPWVSSPPSTAFVAGTIRWRELGRICWRLFSKSSVQTILAAKIFRCFMRISPPMTIFGKDHQSHEGRNSKHQW